MRKIKPVKYISGKKYYALTLNGTTSLIGFVVDSYSNNDNLYLGLVTETGEPYADVTTNIEWMADPDWACIDVNNLTPAILPWLESIGAGRVLEGRHIHSGWCDYPMFAFSDKFLDDIG